MDNPSLPPEYLAAMDSLDELTRAVFVNGDWDVSDVERPFAYAFNKFKTVKSNVAIHPNEPIILSFDFNVDPITCVAGQSYGDKIRIIREFRLKNSDIYRLCETIRIEFGDRLFIVTGDASGANRSAMTRGAVNYYTIIKFLSYAHPQYSLRSIEAQSNYHLISGVNRTSFAGAYWGNGFHEDGVKSALNAIQQFNLIHGFH